MPQSRARVFIVPAIAGLLLFLSRCTSPTADGGTETGNARVFGSLRNIDGSPASGVTVVIRPRNSLADTAGFGLGKRFADTATVTTDDSGRFVIDSVDTGMYVVEGSSGNDAVLIDSVTVQETDTIVELPADTLKPAGALKGIIKLSEGGDPRKVFVLAFGIDRFASVDSLGRFRFQNLAEAAYDLRIISTLDDYGVLDTIGVPVVSADTTDLNTIELPYSGIPTPSGLTLAYDTLKQIVTLTWNQADTGLVSGYNVYRQHVDSGLLKLNSAVITDTVYRDSTALQDNSYNYQVKSVDKAGNEGLLSGGVGVEAVSAFEFLGEFGEGVLGSPEGVHVGVNGKLYVCESLYDMIVVFDTAGNVLRKFGQDTLDVPVDVSTDQNGNIFVADIGRRAIFKFDSTGILIKTWDGTDSASFGHLRYMGSIACDTIGNVFVTNYDLDAIRSFDTLGNSRTMHGTTGTGEGQFNTPQGIELDNKGRFYVCDNGNKRIQILDQDYGFISSWPVGNSFYICLDGRGGFYTTRGYDTPPTVLYTNTQDSSTAILGFEGDTAGAFLRPTGVALFTDDLLYVADSQRDVVLRFRKR